jgi:hypothetical protein
MDKTPEGIRQALGHMPEPVPPDSLWPRLLLRRRRQVRRRRVVAGLASTGMVAAFVALLARPGWTPEPPPPPVAQPVRAAAGHQLDAQVRAIDRALQVAYVRGASDSEVAPMWEARRHLLAALGNPRVRATDANEI